ncbi:hypothetical protein IOD13_09440 [Brevibacterium casei]|nr:hypothetical protein [Brevibacterium casei]
MAEAQRLINDGETYEVCLTNMLEMPWTRDAPQTYGDLRRDNPHTVRSIPQVARGERPEHVAGAFRGSSRLRV